MTHPTDAKRLVQRTFGSLFSGIGGFDLGLERAGWQCSWQVECDAAANRCLAHHWPHTTRHCDVCTFPPKRYEFGYSWRGAPTGPFAPDVRRDATADEWRVDLICGGFPCQDLSVAGKRQGLAGERSGLFHEFMRIVAELAPRWVLIENVPGLLSSNGGRDMATVVGTLGQLGYWWAYRVFDAQFNGLAQRRERVFIVASAVSRTDPAEILFDAESLSWDSPPGGKARERVAATTESGSGGGGVIAFNHQSGGSRDFLGISTDRTSALGCTQTPAVAYGGNNTQGPIEVATACNAHGGTGRLDFESETFVVGPLQSHTQAHGHAMTTQQAAESGHIVAHTLRAEGRDASEDGTGRGVPLVPAIAFTERRRKNGQQVEYQEDLAYALLNPGKGGRTDERMICTPRRAVRRLLPIECERLQGFPDGWTEPCGSDSARYRCLGNAVAVPEAEWIGRRIIGAATWPPPKN